MPKLPGNRGQATPGAAGRFAVGVAAIALIGMGVVIPIINQTIQDVGLSGVEATIASFTSTIVLLLLFLAVAAPVMR